MPVDWEGRIERQYKALECSPTTSWNKKIIKWFVEQYASRECITPNRKDKWIRYLRELAILAGKDFNKMSKEDINLLIGKLEKRFPEEWTFVDCKKMLKTFFRFYMDHIADEKDKQKEYLSLLPVLKAVNKIKTQYRKDKKKPLIILTKEEIEKLFRVASGDLRELCIVSFAYHTAARPSEFIKMNVGDVKVNGEMTTYFTVAGKTGTRSLPLEADETVSQLLIDYLNNHPTANDKTAPLWINQFGKRLSESTLSHMLNRISKKAGITSVIPKLLRKAKLTHMAEDGFNAYQISKYAGHSRLETAQFYVDLSQKGFEEAIKKKYSRNEQKQILLKPKKCWKCGHLNPSFNMVCKKCAFPLEIEQIEEKKKDELFSIVEKIIEKRLEEKLKELKIS
jgi:site-specific recombinase XerD